MKSKQIHRVQGLVAHPASVFQSSPAGSADVSGASAASSGHGDARSGHFDPSSGHSKTYVRNAEECLVSALLDAPVIDQLEQVSDELRLDLEDRAALPRAKARLDRADMEAVVLEVCRGRYVRLSALAQLLQRNPDALRKHYMDKLVKNGHMLRAFPSTPNHEMQSYRSKEEP